MVDAMRKLQISFSGRFPLGKVSEKTLSEWHRDGLWGLGRIWAVGLTASPVSQGTQLPARSLPFQPPTEVLQRGGYARGATQKVKKNYLACVPLNLESGFDISNFSGVKPIF